jgi:hypothetical protein
MATGRAKQAAEYDARSHTGATWFFAASFSALSASICAKKDFCSSESSGALASLFAQGCTVRSRQTPSGLACAASAS